MVLNIRNHAQRARTPCPCLPSRRRPTAVRNNLEHAQSRAKHAGNVLLLVTPAQAGGALQQTNVWSSSACRPSKAKALDSCFRRNDGQNQTLPGAHDWPGAAMCGSSLPSRSGARRRIRPAGWLAWMPASSTPGQATAWMPELRQRRTQLPDALSLNPRSRARTRRLAEPVGANAGCPSFGSVFSDKRENEPGRRQADGTPGTAGGGTYS